MIRISGCLSLTFRTDAGDQDAQCPKSYIKFWRVMTAVAPEVSVSTLLSEACSAGLLWRILMVVHACRERVMRVVFEIDFETLDRLGIARKIFDRCTFLLVVNR